MILESSAPWSSEKEMVFSKQFPLHHACRDSNTETLKRLLIQLQHNISNCNLVLSEDSEYGWTAAHFAAYFGSLECLRLLMQAGTMFNSSRESSGLPSLSCPLLSVTSKWKQTLLHVAAFADRPRCVQWLIARGLPVNAKDYNGETALHKACRTGSWECIHLLVSCNADASIRNHAGLNSADIAASCGHQDVCERLRQLVGESTPAATNGLKHLVSSNGYYGFSANNNTTAAGDDDEMETESDTSSPSSSTVQRPVTDVLVNDAVSQNLVPVAGRKRSREEDESSQAKRGRFQDDASSSHTGTNHQILTSREDNVASSQDSKPLNFIHDANAEPRVVADRMDNLGPNFLHYQRRKDRFSSNSTDSIDSGFSGSSGDQNIGSRCLDSIDEKPLPVVNGLALNCVNEGTFGNVSSGNMSVGVVRSANGGSFDPGVSTSSRNFDLPSNAMRVDYKNDRLSCTSGYPGCPIPAPADLLAHDADVTAAPFVLSRKLFGGHMF
ncbi:ankyrin repeat domain-containing protein 10 isoform X3 [Hyalella azteca]|uniref:Ankyrin repeat domain-containing protein 10 isoform X3 n=1 Tax=Hyalella azteca TaxID=294128 RepID=A0A8B7N1P4_HYAAZ|nr:ankyrin repeat domain-containing protein 10 isoform X3 [Hyalella azteca]